MTTQLPDTSSWLDGALSTHLLLGSRIQSNSVLEIRRLQIQTGVSGELRKVIESFLSSISSSQVREYEPTYKPDDHQILRYAITPGSSVSATLDAFAPLGQLSLDSQDNAFRRGLRFYAIAVETPTETLFFFRSVSHAKLLRQNRGLSLWFSDGVYTRLTQELFVIDSQIDCFARGNEVFIVSPRAFERIFDYLEQVRSEAASTLAQIKPRVPIANFDDFADACTNDPRLAHKLAAIATKPYLATITIDQICDTITRFGLSVEVLTTGSHRELVFDNSPHTRWLILKLLDDDYLDSKMTGKQYEVNSKTSPGQ